MFCWCDIGHLSWSYICKVREINLFSRSVFAPRCLETRETNKTSSSILFCNNLGWSHKNTKECASCFYACNQNNSSAFVAILRRSGPYFLLDHIALIASQTAKIVAMFTASDAVSLALVFEGYLSFDRRSAFCLSLDVWRLQTHAFTDWCETWNQV